MLCPKCKIEAVNKRDDSGNWVAVCRNPRCSDFSKTITVLIPFEDSLSDKDA